MKLELTLPERPGFLHALPVVNLFLLLVLFFMVGPSLILQSGVTVNLPASRFQLERSLQDQETLVVTLGAGQDGNSVHFGRRNVTLEELAEMLDKKRAEGSAARPVVFLRTEGGVPVAREREVVEMILSKRFQLALVGQAAAAEGADKPARTGAP